MNQLKSSPLMNPTPEQLQIWANKNPDFLEKINKEVLPEHRLELMKEIYQESLNRYLNFQREQVAKELVNLSQQKITRDKSPVRKSKRTVTRSVKEQIPKQTNNSGIPSILLQEISSISLQSFFSFDSLITINNINPWKEENLAAQEDPELIALLACLKLVFKEKAGQTFRIVDATRYLNLTFDPTPEKIETSLWFYQKQSAISKAWLVASLHPSVQNIENLAQALQDGQELIIQQGVLSCVLDSFKRTSIFQKNRNKILTLYSQWIRELH